MSRKASNVSDSIIWSDAMISRALTLVERPENAIVLLGKREKSKNTSGESKIVVHTRIASDPQVLGQLHKKNPTLAGKKWQSKFNSLCKTYQEKHKELMGTGGGLGNRTLLSPAGEEDDAKTGAPAQLKLDFYLGPNGPDKDAPEAAWNIWNQATSEFKWFQQLHKILSTRPNQVPVALTTGIGPNGPQTVLHQPPSRSESPDHDEIETNCLDKVAVPNENPTLPTGCVSVNITNRNATPGPSVAARNNAPHAPSPSPLLIGKGKQVHPGEHKPKELAPPTPSNNTASLDKKAKVMKMGPSTSTNMAKFKQVNKEVPSSTGSGQTLGKCKNREMDGIFALHQNFSEQQAKRDTQKAYESEIDLLIKTKSVINMSDNEFYRREHEIKKRFGRLGPNEKTPPPVKYYQQDHPLLPTHNMGRTFDPNVIMISLSPSGTGTPVNCCGTPIKQETDDMTIDPNPSNLSLPLPQEIGRRSAPL